MARLDNDKIDEIRQSVNIVDVVSDYIDLQKKGRNYWAVCPFHDDKDPSLSISEDKQIYKCFVCGNGGNAFTFIQDFENISFMEAVKKVAEKAGIDVKISKPYTGEKQQDPKLLKYYEINRLANEFFSMTLNSVGGKKAKEYLLNRGINDEVNSRFSIGLSPKNNELTKFLLSRGYSDIEVISAGIGREYNGNLVDVFKDRIIFAIKNINGDPIAFSGRTYVSNNGPKYINTSETPIFSKGKVLYNLHSSKQIAKRERSIIVLEGFMDVIALSKVDINNTVATMGTAFTRDHVQHLKSVTKNVKLFMDGDKAGVIANIKLSDLLIESGFNVSVVNNTSPMDADELLSKFGKEKICDLLDNVVDPFDYRIAAFKNSSQHNNSQSIQKFLASSINTLKKIDDKIAREIAINKLSDSLGVSKNLIWEKLGVGSTIKYEKSTNRPKKEKKNSYQQAKRILDKYQTAERNILMQMINNKKAASIYRDELGYFFDKTNKIIANYILNFYENNKDVSVSSLISRISDKEIIDRLTELELSNLPGEFNSKELSENIRIVKNKSIEFKIENLMNQLKNSDNEIEKANVLKEIIKLKKEGSN